MEHECTTSNNLDPNDPEAPGDYQDCVDHQDPADRQVLCSDTSTTLPKSVPVLEPMRPNSFTKLLGSQLVDFSHETSMRGSR